MSEPSLKESSKGIYLGDTRTYRTPLMLDLEEMMNKNIAVLGMSGSGKSFFLKSFIIRSRLWRGSTILIIDWNNEYGQVVGYLNGSILRVGSTFQINIFELYDLRDKKNIGRIAELIGSTLSLNQEEIYLIYSKALEMCVHRKEANLRALINLLGEGKENLEKLAKKLLQLNDNPLFADKTKFQLDSLMNGVISIDFSLLKDDAQRSEISKAVLRLVVELMHRSGFANGSNVVEKIIILDETWRLIKNSEDIGTLFREGRKYGFCIAVATQLVNDISSEILSNSASVFLFRLQNDNDYRLLLESGIITEQEKKKLMDLPMGSCMVSTALKENEGAVSKFFLERIKGAEISWYKIKSGSMQIAISNRVFLSSTSRLLAEKEAKERIINFCSEHGNELDLRLFIRFLLGLKIERAEIIFYLRQIGLRDFDILRAYSDSMDLSIKNSD
jgi:DNA helicase HerA-like ATPase